MCYVVNVNERGAVHSIHHQENKDRNDSSEGKGTTTRAPGLVRGEEEEGDSYAGACAPVKRFVIYTDHNCLCLCSVALAWETVNDISIHVTMDSTETTPLATGKADNARPAGMAIDKKARRTRGME